MSTGGNGSRKKFFYTPKPKIKGASSNGKSGGSTKPKPRTTYLERVRRLLNIIRLSQGGRPKIEDLAAYCHIGIRTIYRDIDKLRELGIVISTHPETHRVSISDPVYLPPVQFTLDEAFTMLTLCFEAAKEPAFPLFDAIGEATCKLFGALPQKITDQLRPLTGKVLIQKAPIHLHDASRSAFETIRQAIVTNKAISIRYKSPRDPDAISTTLHPYQVLFARHAWYVIGWAGLFKGIRTFHIGRILEEQLTVMHYEIPKSFSLDRYLRNAWCLIPEPGPDSDVEIRFSPLVAQNVAEVRWHKTQQIEKNERDGSLIFRVRVSGLNEISWWILGYGKEAEVLKPVGLREIMRKHVEELSKIYLTGETSFLNPLNAIPSLDPMKHPLEGFQ